MIAVDSNIWIYYLDPTTKEHENVKIELEKVYSIRRYTDEHHDLDGGFSLLFQSLQVDERRACEYDKESAETFNSHGGRL